MIKIKADKNKNIEATKQIISCFVILSISSRHHLSNFILHSTLPPTPRQRDEPRSTLENLVLMVPCPSVSMLARVCVDGKEGEKKKKRAGRLTNRAMQREGRFRYCGREWGTRKRLCKSVGGGAKWSSPWFCSHEYEELCTLVHVQ